MSEPVRFQTTSDNSLLLRFGDSLNSGVHRQVRKLLHLLGTAPIRAVTNLHPAYCSILFDFDALRITHADLELVLRDYLRRSGALQLAEPRTIEIPACYDGEFAPDLAEVAQLRSLTPSRVIELHSSAVYTVYFLGFVPGFAYLGEVPAELATPRRASPRAKVPPGSIGIADSQTGIYPFATPGGWQLIGRTPLTLFQPWRDSMSMLNVGDRVRFAPISSSEFAKIQSK
ncbi:MAG TPA: 5-oxoprolinase subunit PxpB [Candidatus Aquilonibacter sp.]|nr:5-oxoprolinase subunit PxpB [Candidatus Aquilonibacter sp.]